ncbi:MAG: efflux RND transporter periplasmic adaptor subunit [Gammaproteobacteria bacterium]|nr:MAG: efflux RND transporter periplasmic adaptor subunit [Gammaproteobacteria bacterium]UCH39183.1 MAG: efflux RND transporter periplasmic adaptor subunit [Gammaproteobacteria bacterium]
MDNRQVKDRSSTRARPRPWLRILSVLILLIALAGVLAYKKTLQIQQQIEQGSKPPPPISVTVAEAEPSQWDKRIKAIGTLVAFQGVDITTEISGIITAINFDSGDETSEGDLLVELDNRTEMANLESARAQFESDNSQYQRLLKLKDQSFVTSNDIDTQASLVNIARAEVSVAETALAKKRIYAPFSGRLGIRQIDLGEYVAPGTPIVTLLSLNRLYLDFTLPESNFIDLSVGQKIEFKVRSYPNEIFTARVETWNPELDANTRNIKARAVVDNSKRLLAPGMFADMHLASRLHEQVLTVPETAIFYNIYGEAVYTLEKPEPTDAEPQPDYRLAARQVEVAYRAMGTAAVRGGINAGDLVVTSGQLKLYPGLRVAIVDDVADMRTSNEQ